MGMVGKKLAAMGWLKSFLCWPGKEKLGRPGQHEDQEHDN